MHFTSSLWLGGDRSRPPETQCDLDRDAAGVPGRPGRSGRATARVLLLCLLLGALPAPARGLHAAGRHGGHPERSGLCAAFDLLGQAVAPIKCPRDQRSSRADGQPALEAEPQGGRMIVRASTGTSGAVLPSQDRAARRNLGIALSGDERDSAEASASHTGRVASASGLSPGPSGEPGRRDCEGDQDRPVASDRVCQGGRCRGSGVSGADSCRLPTRQRAQSGGATLSDVRTVQDIDDRDEDGRIDGSEERGGADIRLGIESDCIDRVPACEDRDAGAIGICPGVCDGGDVAPCPGVRETGPRRDNRCDGSDSGQGMTARGGPRLYQLNQTLGGWDYGRLRDDLDVRLPAAGTTVVSVIDRDWLITTGAANDDLIQEIAPRAMLVATEPMDDRMLAALGADRSVGLAWNQLLGFEEVRWMDLSDLRGSLLLLDEIDEVDPDGAGMEREPPRVDGALRDPGAAGGSAFSQPFRFKRHGGGFVIPDGMSPTELVLRHAQARPPGPYLPDERDPPEPMIAVAGAGGTCSTMAREHASWTDDYGDLAAEDDRLAREIMDWGRYSPNVGPTSRHRHGLTEYLGGRRRAIQAFIKGSDDWNNGDLLDAARADAIVAAIRWEDVHDEGYVHSTTVDVDQILVVTDSVARARASATEDDDLLGPWRLGFEPEVEEALYSEYSSSSFPGGPSADGVAECASEDGDGDGEDRFGCLVQAIRVSLGDDFVHLSYIVQSWGETRMGTASAGFWCSGGCALMGLPYSLVIWHMVPPMVDYCKRSMVHEMGHNIGAGDEYASAGNDCDSRFGYLGHRHENNVGCGSLVCTYRGINVPANNVTLERDTLCGWSAGQVGLSDRQRGASDDEWIDWSRRGDCVYDVHDSYPAAFLREAPMMAVGLVVMGGMGVSFHGEDPIAEAERFLVDFGILERGQLAAAWTWFTFPGYAFDCGVDKFLTGGQGRWAITINEIRDARFRYRGPPQAAIGEMTGHLDGATHDLDRATLGPSREYAFEKIGLTLKYPARIIGGTSPGSRQTVWWAARPAITAADFEVEIILDNGNSVEGEDPMTCDPEILVSGGGGSAMRMSEPRGPYLLARVGENLFVEAGMRELAARLVGRYGSLDGIPGLEMTWVKWQSQLDALGLREGVDFSPPGAP